MDGALGLASTARFQAWRALLSGERVITHNLIVGSGTIGAGLLGVAFQSFFSHRLQPSDYGAVFAIVSLLSLIALPATAFQLLMARESSRDRVTGRYAVSAAVLRQGNRALIVFGSALAAVVVLISPLLAQFLAIPAQLLVATAVGIPFGLALPLLIGEFQGEQRFMWFSLLAIGQAACKLIAAVALGAIWGPLGIVAGISLATLLMYAVAVLGLRRKLSIRSSASWRRPAARYLAIVLPSTLALGVLLSTDVLLVKHYFSTQAAGQYSAVAALGRAIFWGATGVATVLFPKVIARRVGGESGIHLILVSVALVGLGGLLAFALLSIGSAGLLAAFAGSGYAAASSYMPWYALAMTLLGGAAVLIATHQAAGRAGFLAVLLPLTVVEPALVVAFHQTLLQVVQVVDESMALVFVGLGALYLVQQRSQGATTMRLVTGQVAPVRVNQ